MKARFATRCPACSERIPQGAEIVRSAQHDSKFVHAACADAATPVHTPVNPYRRGSKRHVIAASLLSNGGDVNGTIRDLTNDVGVEPLVFKRNVNGVRLPKAHDEQLVDFGNEVRRTAKDLQARSLQPVPEIPQPDKPEPAPVIPADPTEQFWQEWQRLRDWLNGQIPDPSDPNSSAFDNLDSYRIGKNAGKAIRAGVPVEAMIAAMTITWPREAKEQAGVPLAYDFAAIGKDRTPDDAAPHTGYAEILIEADVPVLMKGSPGISKSYSLPGVAERLGLEYAECPLTGGATPAWLLGRNDRDGYKESAAIRLYRDGGLFSFEEVDGADSNMLLVANQLIESRLFFNPVNGVTYERHPDFRVAATANTWGLGANAAHAGRERLDTATTDRFRMGRFDVSYDVTTARMLLNG